VLRPQSVRTRSAAGRGVAAAPAAAIEASVALTANCAEPGGPALLAGPWLTDVTTTSASVQLVLGGDVATSVYFLEHDGRCDADTLYTKGTRVPATRVTQTDVPYSQPGDLVPEKLYSATLRLDAAAADRRFCYGIELPPTPWMPKNRYVCPPQLERGFAGTSFVVPGSGGDRFVFYVYGDTRDPSGFNKIHDELAEWMTADLTADLETGRDAAELLINTGDFAYDGCDAGLWLSNFFAPTRALAQQLPLWTAPGNHEGYSEQGGPPCPNRSFYFAYFAAPYRRESSRAPGMYRFDHKNVRFISLDLIGDEKADSAGLDPAVCNRDNAGAEPCAYDWLKAQLLGEGAADWNDIDHVIVFYHAPLITAPPAGKHASSNFQIAALAPLFERPDGVHPGKVTAVLTGHNHFYERSQPLTDLCLASDTGCRAARQPPCPGDPTPDGFQFPDVCYRQDPKNGIHYVISGGGGAEPYQAPPGPFPIRWLAVADGAYHYLKLTIDGRRAWLEATGFRGDGTRFDERVTLRE
ncbi:MAG: hypothetical protein HC897_04340, partial [Thermoanaerobaculia bacterium]|nr:hypothetical protein [Thermoanaerobaculia bacterium]